VNGTVGVTVSLARPHKAVGLTVDLVADVRQLEQRIAAVEARIKAAVAQSNTSLVQLFGSGRCWPPRFPRS
jgi:hypothetical protein